MRVAVFAFAATASLVAVGACSTESVVSPGTDAGIAVDSSVADAADAALPYPLGQSCAPVTLPEGTEEKACSECSQSRCCDSRAALVAFSDAQDLATCVGASSCDSRCEEACFAKYPRPAQALLDHGVCKTYLCESCRAKKLTACETCIQERCTTEDLACSRSAGCFVVSGCVAGCSGDKACIQKCQEDFPAALPLLASLTSCFTARCPSECPDKK